MFAGLTACLPDSRVCGSPCGLIGWIFGSRTSRQEIRRLQNLLETEEKLQTEKRLSLMDKIEKEE